MTRFVIGIAVALPLLAGAGEAAAQRLEPGKWTGTVTEPSGSTENITYDVTVKGDTIGIAANVNGGTQVVVFRDVKLDGATLTFGFPAPSPVQCKLTRRDDNGYEGACRRPEATREGRLVMVPPKKD